MFLFLDTETTGLPKSWRAPLSDLDNWPRLVQLAWLMVDKEGRELGGQNYIIKPDGFTIPKEASRVHGISTRRALSEGIELSKALRDFNEAVNSSGIIIAHNISFDEKIVGAELMRNRIAHGLFEKPKICTMRSSIDYCALPPVNGGINYKFPKLIELYNCLFNQDFANAHDALADVRATARCFFELKKRGVL